jgi:RNA polymerase sigma factor (sigma-70 family)
VATAAQVVEAVFRRESARLIAGLTRVLRGDVGLAEDLAQDACLLALEQWPRSGVPDNPGAWLMATARHRAVDRLRHARMADGKHQQIGQALDDASGAPDLDTALDDNIGDDLLGLMFIACHPVLAAEARVALTLRLTAGLTTEEIARAYLVPVSTIQQRIVRAKRTLSAAGVPFEVPRGDALAARVTSVLEVTYLIFNEGYSATAGDEWMRPALCEEALRLGRILAELVPDHAEAHGLVALMELQSSRTAARTDASGQPVLLLDQDRTRWDQDRIQRGRVALRRVTSLKGSVGPYALQAAIAGCHAFARTAEETDWTTIVALYDALVQVAPSPVVQLNRAVALAMAFGPVAGLEVVDALRSEPLLKDYHLLPSVRGDLLLKLGRFAEARAAFEEAAAMTGNAREQALLHQRAAACVPTG